MSAEVGGSLEEVAPHRSLFGPDYTRLLVLAVVGVAIHAWLVLHTAVPARDSMGYARIAVNLSNPSAASDGKLRQRIDVIRDAEQPPGYPVAIWAVEKALRPVTHLPLSERALLAAQLANAAAAVLLAVPLYLIGRILFGRNVGFAAALLFEVLPVPAHMTSDGLSEGLYLLVVATAILLGVRSLRNPGVGGFLLCGLACGASYLVRPEGLGLAMGVGSVIAVAGLTRRWQRDHACGYLAALLVGVGLVGLPYMLLIGKISNKPTTKHMFEPGTAPIWRGMPQDTKAKDVVHGRELFATWWDPKRDEGKIRELWALDAVWSELIKSSHYVICILAAFALVAHRRQLFSPDYGMWLLIALLALNAAVMFYLAERIWYVSERHTLLFVMISCVLAAASLKPLAGLICALPLIGRLVVWPRLLPAGLLFTIVTSTMPSTLQNLHAQREGHKQAGRWLAENMSPDDDLIDPLAWAEWYSGCTLYETTKYHANPKIKWVVLEECKSPHSRLPQWEYANEEAKTGKRVFSWPENPSSKTTVVSVYRVDVEAATPAPAKAPPPPREAPTPGGRP